MRISFDLDETLFIDPEKISAEPERKFPLRLIYKERLRKGTPELMKRIRQNGIDLHVDDDISVKQNGDIYGFKVFLLNDENKTWAENLWDRIEKMNRNRNLGPIEHDLR